MRHWKAKRLLPALPDGMLDEVTEADLEVHVASCARCRRLRRDFERAESLLRRMPTSLLPLESSPLSYGRLVSLSRWSPEPELRAPDRLRVPFLALASAVLLFFIAASVNSWSPVVVGEGSGLDLGFARPDSDYFPTTWR